MAAPSVYATLPDTGPRVLPVNEAEVTAGTVTVQRVGSLVSLQGTGLALTGVSTNFFLLAQALPTGFRPVLNLDGSESVPLLQFTASIGLVEHTANGNFRMRNVGAREHARFSTMFFTRNPWPTTLPGSPL